MKKVIVMADYVFGIFAPTGAMDPELLGAPPELCMRFKSWLRGYREYHDAPRGYDRRGFNEQGRLLAREIQRVVAGEYAVTYRYLLPSHDSTHETKYAAEQFS